MPYAKQRTADDIAAILEASEIDHTGHAISRHVDIDDNNLLRRVVGDNLDMATRFATRTDLINATRDVLNSPPGQAALGLLDGGQDRAAAEDAPVGGNYFADTEWGEVFRFPSPEALGAPAAPGAATSTRGLTTTAHMGSQRRVKVTKVTVVIKKVATNLRIVTSYPSGISD